MCLLINQDTSLLVIGNSYALFVINILALPWKQDKVNILKFLLSYCFSLHGTTSVHYYFNFKFLLILKKEKVVKIRKIKKEMTYLLESRPSEQWTYLKRTTHNKWEISSSINCMQMVKISQHQLEKSWKGLCCSVKRVDWRREGKMDFWRFMPGLLQEDKVSWYARSRWW